MARLDEILEHGEILGHISADLLRYTTILVRIDENYLLVACAYQLSGDNSLLFGSIAGGRTIISFDSREERDLAWKKYHQIKSMATKQIYI